jgi:hypothetical protein
VPPSNPPNPATNLVARGIPPFGSNDADLYINPANFRDIFAADVSPQRTSLMAVTQRPAAGTAFAEKSGPPAWKSLPAWAIVGGADHTPAAQHLFAQRMGATVATVAGSHASMVSQPDQVTASIVQAAQTA